MKTRIFALTVVLAAFACSAFAQTAESFSSTNLPQTEIDRIIKKFSENEVIFRNALNTYVFIREAKVYSIGLGGQATGKFERNSFMAFDKDGRRIEAKILPPMPISTLYGLEITAADLENLNGIDPFALEPSAIDKYKFTYLGKEKIDELDLYVFEVAPKVIPNWKKSSERLFQGRIWIDDRDLFIVKSKGKAVPEGKERFPIMETWRENIDGKYWFPSFSSADDELVFENGQVAKIKVRVRYKNYGVGRTDITIGEEEELVDEKPTPTPTPKKP
jgi:hypothetical protein